MDYYFILKKSMIFMGATPRNGLLFYFKKINDLFIGATPRNGAFFLKITDSFSTLRSEMD